MPTPIAPGTLNSTIDLKLPSVPSTQVPTETMEDLRAVFAALQILQQEIDTIKDRLAAAGIP